MRTIEILPRCSRNEMRAYVRGVMVSSLLIVFTGCTGPRQWVANGFKVGPEYRKPVAPVAVDWIDAHDVRVRTERAEHAAWWTVFNDPVLSDLVAAAYRQNLTLREAGFRILEVRALRAIAVGSLFPQSQTANASYSHNLVPGTGPDRHFSLWNGSLNLAWEVDFWGRFRRAVEAADADLDASVENYDDVLVTLVADVAITYVEIRSFQRRLELVRQNVEAQRGTYTNAANRLKVGEGNDIDVQQAKSNLAQTEAIVPQLETGLRLSQNQLCLLLGIPPEDLVSRLPKMPIPDAPVNVVVGVPADLLRRRPDVRRAERQLAAQCARIGIAEAELYPHIVLTGNVGVVGSQFDDLFRGGASFGSVGPSLRWNILNYGRILSNVRREDALFQELAVRYQQTVLLANVEAENALVSFLQSQQRLTSVVESAVAARRSNNLVEALDKKGLADPNRVFTVQNFATQQELSAAQTKGDVAQALIAVYRALGGGWQIRLGGAQQVVEPPAAQQPEVLPPPE